MTLQDWFDTRKEQQTAARPADVKIDDNIGKLWVKCFNCSAQLTKKELEAHMMTCPQCGYHFRINAKNRISQLFDEGTFIEMYENISPSDPLEFTDTEAYKIRQERATAATNLNDAVITGIGKVQDEEIATAIMDFEYMGGSMGSVVGEKITLMMEEALKRKIPMLVITASGGARMQESVLSLMQMAKTSCAVARLNEAGILYITILTDPTYGGVTASFGMLGDMIIAEQGARVGFAGRRVIEQTIRQKLPADFQTAEYMMKHGQIDVIAKRDELKDTLAKILKLHKY